MEETFRVRLNCVDYYQSTPTAFDPPLFGPHGSTQQKESPSLPVIRVFGATETGQKVCAHIHGALPYLYLEYKGSLEPRAVEDYKQQLRTSIDHALAISYRRNSYDAKAIFVGHITLVKGVPFYGYHVGYRYFLKGAIMGQPLQPFEAHLQFLLQWMCDFNLYGCAYINVDIVKFREPLPTYTDLAHTKHKWHTKSVRPDQMLNEERFPRQSHCSLEVDICVQDILNRAEIESRNVHADFIERFATHDPEEKLVLSLAGLWRDETKRRKRRMGLSDTSSSPFPPEVLISMSADPRDKSAGGWIHEEEYHEKVKKLIAAENKQCGGNKLQFDGFVKPDALDHQVQTVLESVGDLFPGRFTESLPFELHGTAQVPDANELLTQNITSTTATTPNFDDHDFPYESDEDLAREIALTQRAAKLKEGAGSSESLHEGVREGGALEDTAQREQWRQERYARPSKATHSDGNIDTNVLLTWEAEPIHTNVDDSAADVDKRQGDFPDSIRPRNRARHGTLSAHPPQPINPAQTPTRKVSFMTTDAAGQAELDEDLYRVSDNEPPRACQPLSQTSIKSNASSGQSGVLGFSVSKPMQEEESGIPQASKTVPLQSTQTPIAAIKAMADQISMKTPSTGGGGPRSSMNTLGSSKTTPHPAQVLRLAKQLSSATRSGELGVTLCFARSAPSYVDVEGTMLSKSRPQVIYRDAFYSNETDVPDRSRDYAGREFRLQSTTVPFLPAFDASGESAASYGQATKPAVSKVKDASASAIRSMKCRLRHWEIAAAPPTYDEVQAWIFSQSLSKIQRSRNAVGERAENPVDDSKRLFSQIEGPSQKDRHGFKFSQKLKSTSVRHETQYMSTMSLEVHVNTRNNLAPNPEEDSICCIFWCVKSDDADFQANGTLPGTRIGLLALKDDTDIADRISREVPFDIENEETELDLINRLVDILRSFDPDILTGFEVHNGSWGYLIERARIKFEYNLCDELSRMKSHSHGRFGKETDRWGFNTTSTIRVTGRHMINIWRAMRSELNLLQYTMENVAFHLLHKRIPHYSFASLTEWYQSRTPSELAKVIEYFVSRVQLNLEILDANELIPRTSEQARLIGVDFFSVFSRGSQFKVESFMFRIAKPENFILVSPSRKQVGQQNALECLPLVMEPQSDFYNSPLLVLDFQSLYPSIMIAYNYCYSTCLGRVVSWRGQNKLGFTDFKREPGLLELVKDSINIAPNGMMYVKPEMRKSLLAKMLGEILETRVMVKSGMKVDKQDKTLQQLLNNRQLALKLLANVTYGYTSASFSGRMPASEIADSIVQTGRETLERAIALIHSVERWGAEVVYGDTDSLFVYLKGRTKNQAFEIGQEIAKEVTAMNPKPIKLKFEKVYHPCVLLAKKRYVGFKYESPSQKEPEFDAKGIETVRRDGTPAEQKIEEKALKILFRTADLSQVKSYFQRQCIKIMSGRVSVQDFCYAREVKLGTYADKGPPPPGALISTRRMLEDPRLEPQYGERVPYVVISGAPGARLIDRCVAPEQLLRDEAMELDAEYYISKNLIPPLERIFNLVGANVRQWYDEMPKVLRVRHAAAAAPIYLPNGQQGMIRRTLEGYMRSSHCAVCRSKLAPPSKFSQSARVLCKDCLADAARSVWVLQSQAHRTQKKAAGLEAICRSCSNLPFADDVRCDSKDCPVYYSRVKAQAEERRTTGLLEEIGDASDELAGTQTW